LPEAAGELRNFVSAEKQDGRAHENGNFHRISKHRSLPLLEAYLTAREPRIPGESVSGLAKLRAGRAHMERGERHLGTCDLAGDRLARLRQAVVPGAMSATSLRIVPSSADGSASLP
jgi:hypothetical protein